MSEQQLIDDAMPATEENGALLDEIIDSTQAIRSESDRGRVKSQLSSFLNEVLAGTVLLSSDLISSIESRMAEIDALLSAQISKIIHMPAFQATEASWRGLHTLVHKSVTENTRIRVFNCTKKELLKDFKSASDFDQSTLFKTIYESEYGTFGGAPFSALVGDFEFDSMPQDIELLEQISHVAAAAHAPYSLS